MTSTPALISPTRDDLHGVLSDALRQVRGTDASLDAWSAEPSFVHGACGTANLLWRLGGLVALDWAAPDPTMSRRVAWYEQATPLSKIHGLTFDLTRHPEADARRQRQVEAVELLQCLANARDSDRSS